MEDAFCDNPQCKYHGLRDQHANDNMSFFIEESGVEKRIGRYIYRVYNERDGIKDFSFCDICYSVIGMTKRVSNNDSGFHD
jgi:hypothetical protein